MPSDETVSNLLIRKLSSRCALDQADRDAVRDVPYTITKYEPGAYLVREGELPKRCMFVYGGYAFRQKITSEGARQILSLHLPGDFLDLQNLFLKVSDHNIQALTRLNVALYDIKGLREVALNRPAVAQAMWVDALIDASIYREWIVNVGRRDARARVAHMLCEFALRLESAGIGTDSRYDLPMTQEQLADAVGLTPVHVNRTLRQLMDEGLIDRDKRQLSIGNWEKLRSAGDFSARYLHMDQGGPESI